MAIDYFNRRHPLHGLKVWAALRARRGMYERVLRISPPGPGTRILDVGTTPDLDIAYNNFFERWYPKPSQITICSIEDCSNLERVFPGLTFRRLESERLPFRDREFDLAVSFAVLEHVGSGERQRTFLEECSRVAETAIVYAPYRYFPIEMHTLTPFLHWLPTAWYRALWKMLGLGFWAAEEHLNLVSLRDVRGLLPKDRPARVRLIWSFGWPSNVEIVMGGQSAEPRRNGGHAA
jgi:hypothetical protein